MKILNIKKQKNKYQITLDNNEKISINEHALIDTNILYKKNITNKQLNQIKEENSFYDNYDKVLKMINRKIRSQYEIEKFLLKNEVSNQEKIINKLKELNLINDELFAESFTNDKINLTLDGPYKIKKQLEDNHIDNLYINQALSNFTQDKIDQKIEKIIQKKLKTNNDTSYIFKQKTSMYLSNLGYNSSDIYNHLNNIQIDNSKLEKQMEKIYNKLKIKYDGYTLQNKLKQKLYSKGFTTEEINNFIQKTVH